MPNNLPPPGIDPDLWQELLKRGMKVETRELKPGERPHFNPVTNTMVLPPDVDLGTLGHEVLHAVNTLAPELNPNPTAEFTEAAPYLAGLSSPLNQALLVAAELGLPVGDYPTNLRNALLQSEVAAFELAGSIPDIVGSDVDREEAFGFLFDESVAPHYLFEDPGELASYLREQDLNFFEAFPDLFGPMPGLAGLTTGGPQYGTPNLPAVEAEEEEQPDESMEGIGRMLRELADRTRRTGILPPQELFDLFEQLDTDTQQQILGGMQTQPAPTPAGSGEQSGSAGSLFQEVVAPFVNPNQVSASTAPRLQEAIRNFEPRTYRPRRGINRVVVRRRTRPPSGSTGTQSNLISAI